MNDHRDMVIRDLADAEAQLLARAESLEQDIDVYRALAQVTMHALHDLTRKHDRLRAQHYRLLDEIRMLRAQHREAA